MYEFLPDGSLPTKPAYTQFFSRWHTGPRPFDKPLAPIVLVDTTLPPQIQNGKTYQWAHLELVKSQENYIALVPEDVLLDPPFDSVTCASSIDCSPDSVRRVIIAEWLSNGVTDPLAFEMGAQGFNAQIFRYGLMTGETKMLDTGTLLVEVVLYNPVANSLYPVWMTADNQKYDPDTNKATALAAAELEAEYQGQYGLVAFGGYLDIQDGEVSLVCAKLGSVRGLMKGFAQNVCQPFNTDVHLLNAFYAGQPVPPDYVIPNLIVGGNPETTFGQNLRRHLVYPHRLVNPAQPQ